MAFENIGIGGILNFDTGDAVAKMGKAKGGFMGLSRSADALKSSMARIGSGFQKFSMLGTGVGVGLGFAFKNAISQGINFNKEMENSKIAIGTVLSVAQKIPIGEALKQADVAADKLLVTSAQTAGEMGDLVNIFKSVAGPMTKAGVSMDNIVKLTGDAANAAASLGFDYQQVGTAIAKLQAGTIERGQDFVIMLSGGLGLLKETTEEWRELTDQQRAARIQEMMSELGVAAEQTGNSWEGVTSTLASLRNVVLGAFAKGVMEEARKGILGVNGALFKNLDTIKATAEAWGQHLVYGIRRAVTEVKAFVATVREVATTVRAHIDSVKAKFHELIPGELGNRIIHIGSQIGLWAAALSPIVPILGFILSKVTGIFSIIQGALTILPALFTPVGAIAAAIAAMFIMFPDEMMALVKTIAATAMEIGQAIWGAIQQLLPAIKQLLGSLVSFLQSVIPPLMEFLKVAIDAILAVLVPILKPVLEFVGRVLVTVGEVLGKLFGMLAKLINFLMPAIKFIADIVGGVLQVAFAVIGTILDGIFYVIGLICDALGVVFDILGFVFHVVGQILSVFGEIFSWIWDKIKPAVEFLGKVFKWIGEQIDKHILAPLRKALDAVGAIGEYLGGGSGESTSVDEYAKELMEKQGLSKDEAYKVAKRVQGAGKKKKKQGAAPKATALEKQMKQDDHKVPLPEKEPCVSANLKTNINMDGRKVATASQKHTTEIQERAGFNQAPWQTRAARMTGAGGSY